ncbi:MAG TPA: tol-pal system-associated acyl-CoA thioesterase [Lysobacter sp.]|nr:tol-pal system-associated acyl-CoA thioesterase [Lysobacter sp.]
MFSLPIRIYWEDTDAGGVVYHARYLGYLERARSEWMRGLGYGQERLRREFDTVFAVRAVQLDFLKPARLDDALEVTVQLRECRRASALFAQQVRRDGEVLLTASVRVAALDATRFRPAPVPSPLHELMKAQEVAA